MPRTLFHCLVLIFLWAASAVCMTVFSSSPKAHMLLRSRRANTFLEELKPPSLERECMEEQCDFEEAREIYQTREATLRFWTKYTDGDQCVSNACKNGVCVDQFQNYICLCNPGFEGKYCDEGITHTNCSVDNGGCDHDCHERKNGTGRYCSCIDGYLLHRDFKQCTPKNQESCGQILIAKSFYQPKPFTGPQPWLIGGEVGKRGESPWQALILNAVGHFHCGGVLLDELWVLTAAHCLEKYLRFGVRLGDYKRFQFEGSEVTRAVTKIVPHPKYNKETTDNDIALLRLELPVKFSTYIVPACLPSQDLAERVLHLNGTKTVVTGWGLNDERTLLYSSDLKHISVPLVEHSECASYMVRNLTENMLCAGSIGIVMDACKGDSGGPMMTLYRNTWFLIGLVSWGEGCGRMDKLGIYTKVSNYLEWIDSVKKQL
ncbi:vitamin K-dependent protein C-like isoform 1-T2 [Clarias gariepinus]|uniref:vitamin K-dependent protein C-like n=1 Tax=Clarias gariepinus TaxID=13013 RepID=UPI00234D5062|nr:vitamin K-dependent protein C-like [Clarias gariepinus]XP_053342048.1 vitamin K-dependent protein C-like [Clarias gariepinus]XP_053342050.1 vitamin K-dependent protein C-like [Clarias gariepinus]